MRDRAVHSSVAVACEVSARPERISLGRVRAGSRTTCCRQSRPRQAAGSHSHRGRWCTSVQANTYPVHPPVCPWSPQSRSQGFLREAASARTAAPRRHGVTSAAAQRRRRSTEWSPRTSRTGSPGEKPPSGPCRAPSRRNSAAISKRHPLLRIRPCSLHGLRLAGRGKSWFSAMLQDHSSRQDRPNGCGAICD